MKFHRAVALSIACLAGVTPAMLAQERQIGGIGLTVFTDPGFRGPSATFREDMSNLQSVGLNDRISSLRVARGETWEVCEHANYQGRCQVVSGSESDLRRVGWNDIISSARPIRTSGRSRGQGPPGRGGRASLELFAGVRYSGERRIFYDELSNLQFVDFNDRALSLRIQGSGFWQVCVDANYVNCVVVDRDTPDLARIGMTRRISSLRPWTGPPR